MAFCVISCRYRHSVWISYARLSPERVIAVGRRRPQRIDRPRDAPLRVVDGLGPAAASVDLRDLPAKAGEPRARRRNARHAADEVGQTGALAVIEEERSMGDAAKQVTIPVRKVDSGASHAC